MLARLIERYGDAYWPVFEKVEGELKIREQRATRLVNRRRLKNRLR